MMDAGQTRRSRRSASGRADNSRDVHHLHPRNLPARAQPVKPLPYPRRTFQNSVNGERITPLSLSLYAAGTNH